MTVSGAQCSVHMVKDIENINLMILEPDNRKYTTINTHLGLFQYNQFSFGIALAPAIFQQQMEKILQGIPKTACYLDDILITGQDDEEHLSIMQKVFGRLH